MLLEKINIKQLAFIENWHKPSELAECLFSDFDNLGYFDRKKTAKVRLYQTPMLSYETSIDFDAIKNHYKLNRQEIFDLRKNIGELFNIGGRLYGKTLITLRVDIALSSLLQAGLKAVVYSVSDQKLHGVLDRVERALKHHPIFRCYNFICKGKPFICFSSPKNNWEIKSVNMALKGKTPGDQFYQHHVDKMWGEEVSFETEEVSNKKDDSVGELGCIFRLAGMTNFTRHHPIGKIFYDPENKEHILNYPRYINPFWNDKKKRKAIEKYGDIETPNYKIYVEGEIIEDGQSVFDIDRVKKCYHKRKEIKRFVLKKQHFKNFEKLIVVERPKNAERIFIAGDIGDGAGGSDIIIVSEIGDKYQYLYNIVLYNWTQAEQFELFKWLISKTQANVVGIDCGDGCGRGLADSLEKTYKKENIVRYAGTNKVITGYETDENDKVILKNGKAIIKEEKMKEWSIRRLMSLLYEVRLQIPIDHKFDNQINQVISTKSGTNTIYACISETGDHLFDAFRILAICIWLKKDFNQTPKMRSEWGTGASSWMPNKNKENK